MNDSSRFGSIAICVSFFAIVFALGLYFPFAEKLTFSDGENRELAPPPELFADGALNTRYYYDMDAHYTDAFPFRGDFLGLNRFVQSVLAPKIGGSEAFDMGKGMMITEDRAFELYTYDEDRVRDYSRAVNAFVKSAGIPAYLLLPPSASELYLPGRYREFQNEQGQAFELLGELLEGVEIIDLNETFKNNKDGYIYFRTDHHWSAEGAYLAYEALCGELGLVAAPLGSMESGRREGFLGSLYKSLSQSPSSEVLKEKPDTVKYYYPLYETEVFAYQDESMTDPEERQLIYTDYEDTSNLYNLFFGGDIKLLHMKSSVANGRSVMVVRDSFGHAFLPFLANNYENVYAVEPRYYDSFDLSGFVAEHGIDELVIVGHSLSATGRYWQDWPGILGALK